jgi:pyruvate/2-oxoglutarate dehydrogenase complex dihydrolipoamide acyltransferase (E2) component
MDTEFVMPMIGVEIEEAEVRQWLKQEGDTVAAGDLLVAIGTPKVDMEVEAPFAGMLKTILVEAGEIASVGAPLAIISKSDS